MVVLDDDRETMGVQNVSAPAEEAEAEAQTRTAKAESMVDSTSTDDADATADVRMVNNSSVTVVTPQTPPTEPPTTMGPTTTTTVAPTTTTTVPVNQSPMANTEWIYVPPGSQRLLRVLENDTDPDGDRLYITDFTQPNDMGRLQKSGDTELLFTAPDEFPGGSQYTVTFTYFIGDGRGGHAQAGVNVSIVPPETKPPNP